MFSITTVIKILFTLAKATYRAFHGFGQDKFANNGLVLGLSQFSTVLQLPPKILLKSKVVKIDSKIIISLH